MRSPSFRSLTALAALLAALPAAAAGKAPVKNPLLQPWAGAHGGVPPFARASVALLEPAVEAGMEAELAAARRVADQEAPPTFENTIAALERSDRLLNRVMTIYGVYDSTLSTPEFQALDRQTAPRLAAHADRILQDPKLFARIAAVYDARDRLCKTPEQKRLTWLYYTNFVRAGARLDDAAKKRVAAINERLATLGTTFKQHLLADEGTATVLDDPKQLDGLPEPVKAAAAAAAEARGEPGKWAILNTRSSVEPFLEYATDRALREKVFRAFVSRGDHGDDHDNNAVISEILRLRAEKARLLGYPTHAHWKLENQMARTPDRALALMEAVWPASVARVREEVRDMQAVADAEGAGIAIAPWDYRFYAEKVRKAKYDLDENVLKPYLELERLREGMFWVAGQLFDFHFRPAPRVPVYHPDVRVWEVTDGRGRHVGYWYFDPFARPGKQSGAWMNAYRRQERMDGEVTTIVSNNANFVKGKPGEPVLVSWTDATTLFHEFGHALHGLCASVTYPSVSGTAVPRDYVEFPSQILERWLPTREVLSRFARHVKTGEPMPPALVERIERSEKFNQGFNTTEYLSAALVDMMLHTAPQGPDDPPIDPRKFEQEALARLGMPAEIVMRHRTAQFAHLFTNDYSAGYYAYLWADTLSADAFEAFVEASGPYDRAVAARLKHLYSLGNSIDPADAYRAFRGRDPGIGALMRRRGFPEPQPAAGTAAPAQR